VSGGERDFFVLFAPFDPPEDLARAFAASTSMAVLKSNQRVINVKKPAIPTQNITDTGRHT